MFIYTAWQAFKYGYQFLKIVFSGNRFFWYSGNFKNWALAISVFENRGGVVKCRAGAFSDLRNHREKELYYFYLQALKAACCRESQAFKIGKLF